MKTERSTPYTPPARADREAHRARIPGELGAIANHLTETLLSQELRAASLRTVYDTKGIA
ncbi:hypothetical protein ACIOFY_36730 [Streptomyces anulatus]